MSTIQRPRATFHVPALSAAVPDQHRRQLLRLLEDDAARRSSGSFYTPTDIARQLVEETLGPLLIAARQAEPPGTHADDDATARYANLRVLDPAMGCGNILLRAAERIVQGMRDDPAARAGERQLRRMVVECCLFGVDSNPVAVRHARAALAAWAELPDDPPALDRHLRCGNSLLSARLAEDLGLAVSSPGDLSPGQGRPPPDRLRAAADCWLAAFFDPSFGPEQLGEIQDAWHDPRRWSQVVRQGWYARLTSLIRERLNPFHWDLEFADRGFDAVIGNPPYVDSVAMRKRAPLERRFLSARWKSAVGNWDLFVPFVELSLECVRPGGAVGLVLPNKLLSADYATRLRAMLHQRRLVSIRDYSHARAFDGVGVYPVTVVLKNERRGSRDVIVGHQMTQAPGNTFTSIRRVATPAARLEHLPDHSWRPLVSEHGCLLSRVFRMARPLSDFATVSGAATVAECYQIGQLIRASDDLPRDEATLRLINTGAIGRYGDTWLTRPVRYLRRAHRQPVVAAAELAQGFPTRSKQARAPKIILAGLSRRLEACLDASGTVLAGKSTVVVRGDRVDLRFLLALLNSRLMSCIYRQLFGGMALAGGYLQISPRQLGKLPVPDIAFQTPPRQRARLLQKAITHYEQAVATDSSSRLMRYIADITSGDDACRDVLHDLLIELAEAMCRMHDERQQAVHDYHRRLEARLGTPIDQLHGKSILRSFDQHPWSLVRRTLSRNRRRLPADLQSPALHKKLQTDHQQTSQSILRLNTQQDATDRIIDACVFRLYGITPGQCQPWIDC